MKRTNEKITDVQDEVGPVTTTTTPTTNKVARRDDEENDEKTTGTADSTQPAAVKTYDEAAIKTLEQTFISILTRNLDTRLVLNPLEQACHDAATMFARRRWLYLEFGVFSGKTINEMAHILSQETIHGFDTFTGLPERWRDGFEKNKFDRKGQLPQVRPNVRLHVGLFQDTLGPFLQSNPGSPVAVVHLDADLYSATSFVLSALAKAHRIVPGTLLVFDELINFPQYREGEWKALLECIIEFKWQVKFLYQAAYMEVTPVLDIYSTQQVCVRIERIDGNGGAV